MADFNWDQYPTVSGSTPTNKNLFANPNNQGNSTPTTLPQQPQAYSKNPLNAALSSGGSMLGQLLGNGLGAAGAVGSEVAGLGPEDPAADAAAAGSLSLGNKVLSPALSGLGAGVGNSLADLLRALRGDQSVSLGQTATNFPGEVAQGVGSSLLSPLLGGLLHPPTTLMEAGVNPYLEGKGMLGGLIPGAQGSVDIEQVLNELPRSGKYTPTELETALGRIRGSINDTLGSQSTGSLNDTLSPVNLSTGNQIKRDLPFFPDPTGAYQALSDAAQKGINNQIYAQAPLAQRLNAAYSLLTKAGNGIGNSVAPLLGIAAGEKLFPAMGIGGIGGYFAGRNIGTPMVKGLGNFIGKQIPYGGSLAGQGLLTLLGL